MTTLTAPPPTPAAWPPTDRRRTRLCIATILACLPYVTLKTA
ncbi:hypothetical protein [Luteipulveratus halotolerans]|nr:hypothetical protein [Luteipulveratus halotolerans]